MADRKERNDKAHKLPKEKDREYGPYGQQRPGKRPDADESDIENDVREKAWQPSGE